MAEQPPSTAGTNFFGRSFSRLPSRRGSSPNAGAFAPHCSRVFREPANGAWKWGLPNIAAEEVGHVGRLQVRNRGRIFPGGCRDQIGRAADAGGVPERSEVGHRRSGDGRDAAVADRGDDRAAYGHRGRAQGAEIPAPDGRTDRRQARAGDLRGRHASDGDLDRRAADGGRALRQRDGRAADDRPAQHAVRTARACRAARSGRPRRRDDAHAAVSAAVHRARDILAVLAHASDRPEGLPARRL